MFQGEWSVIAKDSGHQIDTKCLLSVIVPKHYKMPRFLEPLKAVLTEEGAVNLECKVIGVPQPTLSWYKDGVELKAGDIHRLMSGKDGSCCLGTYTCVATNCMGSVTSSAALLGFEDTHEQEHAIAHDLQTPDISDGNIKPFSLSTIQEERTSQMMSPEAAQVTETLRQQSIENDDQISVISMGKLDQDGELSLSIGNQEVTLSLYQTPDLSEGDAKNICEMFADELAESINESNYVELPPLRFTKETAKASNINMEAVIIDIDQQDLQEYESMKMALENIDDLQTECDIDDVSVAEWNEDPIRGTEFETLTCEEILELDNEDIKNEQMGEIEQLKKEETVLQKEHQSLSKSEVEIVENVQDTSFIIESAKSDEGAKLNVMTSEVSLEQPSARSVENKSDSKSTKPTEKISKVVGVQKKSEKCKLKDETVDLNINWQGGGDSVMVAGDFNNWQPEKMIQGEDGIWSIKKKWQVGKCYLKFIVDGTWVINENLESVTDSEGNVNNQINIPLQNQRKESYDSGSKQGEQKQEENKNSSADLDLLETDTIKRSNKVKTKDKNMSKIVENRNEQSNVATELNDSTPSVTETENTVIIIDSVEKESSITDVHIQNQEVVDIKKEADTKGQKSVANLGLVTQEDQLQQEGEMKTPHHPDEIKEEKLSPGDRTIVNAKENNELQDRISHVLEKNEEKENKLLKDTFEVTEKETTEEFDEEKKMLESFQEQKEIYSEKELLNNDSTNIMRQKKHSKQESVVDSESIPDIETLDGKENIFLTQENKDLLSNDDDLDFDEDFEAFKKERRKSSYEETLAGMDPEILKELGLTSETDKGPDDKEKLDLSLLPTETAEDRLSRIEEKANKIVIEEEPERKSRSRSRSRSKSRPPNLDTVVEKKKEEILEARYYGIQPSLDTIKESPSTASMLGVLQGGVSSASVNTVLQGSASTAEVHKDLLDEALQKDHSDRKVPTAKERISEEKDCHDENQMIENLDLQIDNNQVVLNKEPENKVRAEPNETKTTEECIISTEDQDKENVLDKPSASSKKPKRKAQRSDTKLLKSQEEDNYKDVDKLKNKDVNEKMENRAAMTIEEREELDNCKNIKILNQKEELIKEEKESTENSGHLIEAGLEHEKSKNESQDYAEYEESRKKPMKVKEKKQSEEQSIKENAKCGETFSDANQKKEKEDDGMNKDVNSLAQNTSKDTAERHANENESKSIKKKNQMDEKFAKLDANHEESSYDDENFKKERETGGMEKDVSRPAETISQENFVEQISKEASLQTVSKLVPGNSDEEDENDKKKSKKEENKEKAGEGKLTRKTPEEQKTNMQEVDTEVARRKEEKEPKTNKANEEEQAGKKAEDEQKNIKADGSALLGHKTEEKKKQSLDTELAKEKDEEKQKKERTSEEENAKTVEGAADAKLAKKIQEEEQREKQPAEAEIVGKKSEEGNKKKIAEAELIEKRVAEVTKKAIEAELSKEKEEQQKKPAPEAKMAKKKEGEDSRQTTEIELTKQKDEEEKKWKQAVEAEMIKKIAEEDEKKYKAAEFEVARKIEEDERKNEQAAEAEISKKKAEENEKTKKIVDANFTIKKEEEEQNQKEAAEAEIARKRAEEENEKKNAVETEIAKNKAEEEEKEKKAAEAKLAKKKEEEEQQRVKADEAEIAKRKAEENEKKKKAAEGELAKNKEEEEQQKQKESAEALIVRREAESEEERKKKAAEVELAKKKEEEEQQKKKAAEAERKRKEVEERETGGTEKDANRPAETISQENFVEQISEEASLQTISKLVPGYIEKQDSLEAFDIDMTDPESINKDLKRDVKQSKNNINEIKEKEQDTLKNVTQNEKTKKVIEEEQGMNEKSTELAKKKEEEVQQKKKAVEAELARKKAEEEAEKKRKASEAELAKKKEEEGRMGKKQDHKGLNSGNVEITTEVKKRRDEKKFQSETEVMNESSKRKSTSVSEMFEESSSEDLITITDDISGKTTRSRLNKEMTPQHMSSQKSGKHETNAESSYLPNNKQVDKRSYTKYDSETKKLSGSSSHYSTQETDRGAADYSPSRYKNVSSPVMEHYKAKDANESFTSSSHRDMYKDYVQHKPPTPDMHKYDSLSVTKDVRDSRLSPTYDSRSRNISGEVHYRDTVEKSMQTSQNLMSVVTGSLIQKQEQPKTRPVSAASKQTVKKGSSEQSKEAARRKKLELEKNGVAGAVTDIMIKEVGSSWVSLCWKKPPVSRGSPVITYKVETWLCGEGAFWVELGRTPIPQFDAFNLKPNKCYHFRVTARNKRGWGDAIMTTHKVDLSRPTQMPVITSEMYPIMKALKDSPLKLSIQVIIWTLF